MRLKIVKLITLIVITVLLLSMTPLPVSAAEEEETDIFYHISPDFPKALKYYWDSSSGAYTETRGGSKVLAFTMALASIGMSQELLNVPESISEEDCPYAIETALYPLEWASRFFSDPYTRDKRGFVNFYDLDQGDASYTRASKRTSDQALLIRAMAQGIALVSRNSTTSAKIPQWRKAINETWTFMEDRLHDSSNSGWAVGVTPINKTHYATDWTKSVESNAWAIICLLPIAETVASATGLNKETIKNRCIEAMNFLGWHLFEGVGYVRPFASRDGSITPKFSTCRDIALFGLAAMESYRATNDSTYLIWAKQAMNYGLTALWDNGFGGFFGSVSDEGDILVTGKKTEDNFLAAQLLCQLVVHDTSDLYEPIVGTLLSILRETMGWSQGTTTTDILYPTAVDRKLISNRIWNARTQGLVTFSLTNLPHIVYLERYSLYPIGRETPYILNLQLGYLPRLLLTIQGETSGITFAENITTHGITSIQFLPVQGSQVGFHNLDLALSIRDVMFESRTISIYCGGDILIPQGIIYLLALGVIVGVVIIIVTPPEILKKWLEGLLPSVYAPRGGIIVRDAVVERSMASDSPRTGSKQEGEGPE
ncbi:MAG: hypothetical protein ACFFBD_04980 [Candidatus Hodarchaeota archaeon]